MSFRLQIRSNDTTPLFAQIVHQVREAVALGKLRPGDRIPTLRDLAARLLVNPNTIAKAFQELEREGVVVTRRGAGTFIAENHCALSDAERNRILGEKIEACLTEAVHLRFPRKEVQRLFAESMQRFRWTDGA